MLDGFIRKLIAAVIASVVVAGAIACLVIWHGRFDYSAYAEALRDDNHTDKIGHFPSLPSQGLRPIALPHHFPMLQGGGCIQLLYEADDPQRIWDAWKDRFAYTSPGINEWSISDGKDLRKDMPLVRLQIGENEELGPDWMIGVLIAEPGTGHDQYPWNHGDTAGIAINAVQRRVLYWCETW